MYLISGPCHLFSLQASYEGWDSTSCPRCDCNFCCDLNDVYGGTAAKDLLKTAGVTTDILKRADIFLKPLDGRLFQGDATEDPT
jgi:hypothetical protein